MRKDVGGGWAAPTRKLTPKPSLTTRPLGRRAIRRLTVRRPIRLPGPLLLSSLGQIESRATGAYTRRRRADIVHESIRNQFLEPRKDRSSGARQPWRATHTRAWSPGYISTENGGKRQGTRKRKKEGDDVYNDPRKLVNSQGRSVALRGETRERGTGLLSKFCFRFASWFYDDAPLPPPCRRIRAAPSVFRRTFVLSLFLSRAFWYGYTREGRLWRMGDPNEPAPMLLRHCSSVSPEPE